MFVLFVSMAVTFSLIILVKFVPGVLVDKKRNTLPFPMYSSLLQARIKVVRFREPLTVQVKVTSLLIQASPSCGSKVVNS